jgi:NADH:ubiquinone oxidoreductase subunit 4 (subunit M)
MNEIAAQTLASQPWLSLLTFLPLVGALAIALRQMTAKREANGDIGANEQASIDAVSRRIAMLFTLGAFILSVFITVAYYDPNVAGYQLVESAAWLGQGVG